MSTVIFDQVEGDVRPEESSADEVRPAAEPSPARTDAIELRRTLARARQLDARRRAD